MCATAATIGSSGPWLSWGGGGLTVWGGLAGGLVFGAGVALIVLVAVVGGVLGFLARGIPPSLVSKCDSNLKGFGGFRGWGWGLPVC